MGGIAVALFMAGCASPPAAHGTNAMGTVVIIVEENKPATSILGNPDAPYLNISQPDSALAVNYTAVTHPSLPNYLAMTSGTTAGITDDCNPHGGRCQAHVRSIATRSMRQAGTLEDVRRGHAGAVRGEAIPAGMR